MDKYRMEVERGKIEQSGKSSQHSPKGLKVFFIIIMVIVSFIALSIIMFFLDDMGYKTMSGILFYVAVFGAFYLFLIRPLNKKWGKEREYYTHKELEKMEESASMTTGYDKFGLSDYPYSLRE